MLFITKYDYNSFGDTDYLPAITYVLPVVLIVGVKFVLSARGVFCRKSLGSTLPGIQRANLVFRNEPL